MGDGEGHEGAVRAETGAEAPPPALHAHELTKRFGATVAVDGVSLALRRGEVRGLLGPNGAGKTTLLRMLLGLVQADHGSVELLGRAQRWGSEALAPGVAGLVEQPAFYPYLTGRANLETLALLDGRGAAGPEIDSALARVDLAGAAERRAAGYSTGMRQRLGLASALLREPRLLLLDEPTSGLDPAGARLVGDLVQALAGEGVAVLLSSHQIGEVEEICDSFTVLREGRAVWEGSAVEMRRAAPLPTRRMSTSDDGLAGSIAADAEDVSCEALPGGELAIRCGEEALDRLVLALGRAGVAVRSLEQTRGPLETMFFALTEGPAEELGL